MKIYAVAMAALLLAACGGGGSDTPIINTNIAPLANAGTLQNVVLGTVVTLDGSASADANSDSLTYAWTLTSKPTGSLATLVSSASPKPSFTADAAGDYVASLVVNDGQFDSTAATVTINASAGNAAPMANAGTAQNVVVASLVTLDGSGSSDANRDPLTYAWTLTSKPTGSTAMLGSSTSPKPTFTADAAGDYVASLIVSDGKASSAVATVHVNASAGNAAPMANAGAAQNVVVGAVVTLDGSGSSDANGDSLTYAWTPTSKPTGSTATLASRTSPKPSFTADVAGTYIVSLLVNDGKVNSAFATVSVNASTANATPIANAGVAQTVLVKSVVTLDGSGSSDANGDSLAYAWTLTSKPPGSTAMLASSTSSKPSFAADVAGIYIASLFVNDGKVNSVVATVSVNASAANAVPIANAGVAQNVVAGSLVTLDGSGSSDANGDFLTYAWALTSKPAGSTATLAPRTALRPGFIADSAGTYVASLIVNDGQVDSAVATVSISAAVANVAPVANAGVAQSIAVGSVVMLDGGSSSDANGDPLSYVWTLTSKPTGSTAALGSATSVRPTFTVDLPGTYVVSLVVRDGVVNSSAVTVAVTAVDRTLSSWTVSSAMIAGTTNKLTTIMGKAGGDYGARFNLYCVSTGEKGYFISTDNYTLGSAYLKYRIGHNPVVTATPNWSLSASTGNDTLFAPSVDLTFLKQMYQNWDFSAQVHIGAGYVDAAMDLSGFSAMIDKTQADCGWLNVTFPPHNGWSNVYPDVPPASAKEAVYVAGALEQFGLIAWRAVNSSGVQQLLVQLGQNKALCVGGVLIDDKRLYVEQDGKRASAMSGTDFQLSCKDQLPMTFALQGDFDASRPFVLRAYPHHTSSLSPGQPLSSVTFD